MLLQTALHDWHVSQQARMVEFAGWSMPVQYTSIVDEHRSTRGSAGVFDISHMGRLRFEGSGAERFLDRLVTRRIAGQPLGRIRYALVTNDLGGVLDDVLVYHLSAQDGRPFFLVVVNAGNREKIVGWIHSRLDNAADIRFSDQTLDTAMIAVQGPQALTTVARLVDADVARMKYYTGTAARICGEPCLVSRTGYTGEDGCEFIVAKAVGLGVWEEILAAGAAAGARAVGLGARDTLRLEAAMPLYGHELTETVNPFQAELDFAVQLECHDFVGRDALAAIRSAPLPVVRAGLRLSGKRVPRQQCAVLDGGTAVGEITSGTFSPTLECPIAMAYVRPEFAELGRALQVDIRGRPEVAEVVRLPFYVRP